VANEPVNKLQSAVTRTTAAIGIKTSVFMESAKIKTHISTLKKEIDTLISELGTMVYTSWENDELVMEQINIHCEQIKAKYINIEELTQEIEKLETQEKEVFGKKKAEESVNAANVAATQYVCSSCNTTYQSPVKFCGKCGTKMS